MKCILDSQIHLDKHVHSNGCDRVSRSVGFVQRALFLVSVLSRCSCCFLTLVTLSSSSEPDNQHIQHKLTQAIENAGGQATKDSDGNIVGVCFGLGTWVSSNANLVQQIPTLQRLRIDDQVAEDVAGINLDGLISLDINVGSVSPSLITSISQSKTLKSLKLGMPLEYTQLVELAQAKNLVELGLTDVNEDQAEVVGRMTGMRTLIIPVSSFCGFGEPCSVNLSDKAVSRFGALRRLEQLFIASSEVTGEEISSLSQIKQLRQVVICGGITDVGIQQLAKLEGLTSIGIVSPNITNIGLSNLEALANVEELYLQSPNLTSDMLERISRMRGLRHLSLMACDLSGDGVAEFADFDKLASLSLLGNKLSKRTAESISTIRHLKVLCISGDVSDDDLSYISRLDQLKVLMIDRSSISDRGASSLSKLKTLEYLDISYNNNVGDVFVESVRALPQLKYLNVRNTPITDRHALSLCQITSLRNVNVIETMVTKDGLKMIKSTTPSVAVCHDGADRWDAPEGVLSSTFFVPWGHLLRSQVSIR